MVLDSSALMAILLDESDKAIYEFTIAQADDLKISSATLVEASSVALGRGDVELDNELTELLSRLVVTVVPVDAQQAAIARFALRNFGKGRHKTKLNLGDSFSYALAMHLGEPLLYKGADFAQTDVRSALAA